MLSEREMHLQKLKGLPFQRNNKKIILEKIILEKIIEKIVEF